MRYSADYALIGLMRNHPVNIIFVKMISFNYSFTGIGHIGYGILEYSTSFLIDIMHLIIQCIIGGGTYRTTGFYMQER